MSKKETVSFERALERAYRQGYEVGTLSGMGDGLKILATLIEKRILEVSSSWTRFEERQLAKISRSKGKHSPKIGDKDVQLLMRLFLRNIPKSNPTVSTRGSR